MYSGRRKIKLIMLTEESVVQTSSAVGLFLLYEKACSVKKSVLFYGVCLFWERTLQK